MTTLRLHLTSRRTAAAILSIGIGAVALRLTIAWTDTPTVVLPLLIALLPAAVIGVNTHQPFAELETLAARRLAPLRLAHLTLLLLAALAAVAAVIVHSGLTGTAGIFRNLAGLTGLGLLAATVFGAQLSWTVPLGYLGICVTATTLYPAAAWSWPLLPASNGTATTIALGLLAVGTVVFTHRGDRGRGQGRNWTSG